LLHFVHHHSNLIVFRPDHHAFFSDPAHHEERRLAPPMDRQFLAERAYPYLLATAEFLTEMLEPDAQGKLKLALSTSPEIHDNRLEAFVEPNSNHDLALMRWLFTAVAELADELGETSAAAFWRKTCSVAFWNSSGRALGMSVKLCGLRSVSGNQELCT